MFKSKEVRGFFVPENDKDCHPIVMDEVGNLNKVYPYVKSFGTVVQAGGNLGIFPRALASKFKSVYTFEPDCENFYFLTINCQEKNVVKIQSALGSKPGFINMINDAHEIQNAGAKYVSGSGVIPMLRIDDFGLEECDLIYLDIEGLELEALKGAVETIKKFHPVIGIEDKEICCVRFGVQVGETEKWLIDNFGYSVVDRYCRDVLLAVI